MSVIIRLQNLPLEARSIDIRRFFEGLQIPDGGVHIIGGEKGDAFIAFQSDEDARLAMSRDNFPLCNARIRLYLSSKTEMNNVIAAARSQAAAAAAAAVQQQQQPKVSSLPSSIEQILFKSAQPVVTPKPPAQSSNTAEILSSLTKLFSSPASGSTVATSVQEVAKPTQTHLPQAVDPLKSLASILPMITQQPKSNTTATTTSNLLTTSSQLASQTTAQTNASLASKININQILDMLATHLKSTPTEATTTQASITTAAPVTADYSSTDRSATRDYQTSSSKPDYQYSRQSAQSSSYRQLDSAPPKYASSNGNGSPSTVSASAPQTTMVPQPTQKLDPIIRVKNFAPSAGYKEIRTFLQGVQIEHDGIKLLHDANGQRTGQAFVRLIGIIDLKKALCRNKQFYEDRQIEVMQSNEHEFATTNVIVEYPAMQRHKNMRQQEASKRAPVSSSYQQDPEPETSPNGFYLKIYGLPANFDDQQLKSMFNNVKFVRISTAKPTPINTKIVNADGSTENTTIVKAKKLCQVETQLDLERALTRQDERVGKSKVQIFQISKSEYDREMSYIPGATGRRAPAYIHSNNGGSSNYNSNGNITNEDNHNGVYGTEYMDTTTSDENGTGADEDARFGGSYGVEMSNGSGPADDELYIYMHGVPFSAREAEVKNFFQSSAQPRVVHFLLDADSFKPTGECCCEFGSRSERERALQKDGQLLRNRVIKIRPINAAEYRQHVADLEELRQKQPKRGPRQPLLHTPTSSNEKPRLYSETLINLMKNRQLNNPSLGQKRSAPSSSTSSQKRIRSSPEPDSPVSNMIELPPLPPELQLYKKSIVLLSNVSYEATREDILELFRPYYPIEQTLKIRHDDQGQPTGDAIVACRNADLAVKACTRLNGTNFMGKHIRALMLES